MEKINTLDYIIDSTLKAHPNSNIEIALVYALIYNESISKYITKSYDARNKSLELTNDDIRMCLFDELNKIYYYGYYLLKNDPKISKIKNEIEKNRLLNIKCPYFNEVENILYKIMNLKNINLYLIQNPIVLQEIISIVVFSRYKVSPEYRNDIDSKYAQKDEIKKIDKIKSKLEKDNKKINIIKKIRFNRQAINQCLLELRNGEQLIHKSNNYELDGNMFASQDMGNKRKNQEDSIIIMTHPKNKNFKLLAVADGVGGSELGEKASSDMLKELSEWFESIDPSFYKRPQDLLRLYKREVERISKAIYYNYNYKDNRFVAGSTFTGAIVTKKDTLVLSVGDSRLYTFQDGLLRLETKDDSLVWKMSEEKKNAPLNMDEIDDLRFNVKSNGILSCIGDENVRIKNSFTIPNNYDKLMIFSDGVTDLLSCEQISFFSKNYPMEKITKEMVQYAIKNPAFRNNYSQEGYADMISAGKDNTSAVMFARR